MTSRTPTPLEAVIAVLKGIRIGRIAGFDININPTWFILLFLIVWSLASGALPSGYPGWSPITYWIVALIAALLLFASVLVHELAHSVVARRQGTPVAGITLFLLGGVSNIKREARSAGNEALMAGVGPLTSLILGGLFYGVGVLVTEPSQVRAVLLYLGVINIALAVFNLLPAFPLDGGRLLRALLWWRSRDLLRATRGATRVGVVMGLGLIGLGVFLALTGRALSGIWMGFIGWMLAQAAQASYSQALARRRLSRLPVRRVMVAPPEWIPAQTTLRQAADDYFSELDVRCLPVGAPDERFEGIICLTDVNKQPRGRWSSVTVRDAMIPSGRVVTVTPGEPASEALEKLVENDVNQVAVVDGQSLLGFVDRGRLMRYLDFMRTDSGEESLGVVDDDRSGVVDDDPSGPDQDAPGTIAGSVEPVESPPPRGGAGQPPRPASGTPPAPRRPGEAARPAEHEKDRPAQQKNDRPAADDQPSRAA